MQKLSRFKEYAQRASKFFAVGAAGAIPISITAGNIFYLYPLFLITMAGQWSKRITQLARNPVALSFFAFAAFYIMGIFYTPAHSHHIIHDLVVHSWVLFTPILMLVFNKTQYQRYLLNTFIIAMTIVLVLSYLKVLGVPIPGSHQQHANVFNDHITQNFFMALAAALISYRLLFEKKYRNYSLLKWKRPFLGDFERKVGSKCSCITYTLRPFSPPFRPNSPQNWTFLETLTFKGLVVTKYRGGYALLLTFMTINIVFLDGGRIGWLVLGLLLSYLFTMRFGFKGLALIILAAGLIIPIAYKFSPTFHQRIFRIGNNITHYEHGRIHNSLGTRYSMLENTILLVKKRPWFGYGTGSISKAYSQLPTVDANKTGYYNYMETEYLNIAIEFGLIGLALFFGFLFLQWRMTKTLSFEAKTVMRMVLIAYIAGMIFNRFFSAFAEAHLYSLFVAACFGPANHSD